MKLIKTIKIAYLAYTLYAILIIDVTSLNALEILPALLLMWIIYFIFTAGYKVFSKKNITLRESSEIKINSWILDRKKTTVFIIALFSVIASIGAARFYTGQTPISVFTGLLDNSRSLYAEYQLHARIHNISAFTLRKGPFILMMFYTKLVLFYLAISLILIKEKATLFDKICLALAIGSHIYFGLARGTNYELFEIVILVIFIALSRKASGKRNKFSVVKFSSIFITIGIMIFLFYHRISSRGFVFDYTRNTDFIYNPEGLISMVSTELVFVIILLYDYFGFGFYYISYYILNIWLDSIGNFGSGLIPYGYFLQNNEMITQIVKNNIVMKARWHPDLILVINSLGIIGTFILIFALGIFTRFVSNNKNSSFVYLTEFIILLQMISFPIGNFVFVSSASTLIVILLIWLWLWKITINKKFKLV